MKSGHHKLQKQLKRQAKPKTETVDDMVGEETDAKLAEKLKEKGAHVVVNDDGEIMDRRQLSICWLERRKEA